jgi:HSP20 family protein
MARSLTPWRSGGLAGRGFGGDPFSTFHREIDRLFDDMFGGEAGIRSRGDDGGFLTPHMDVSETENEVRVCAELPGVSDKDVEVTLNDDVLTIRGEKKSERKEEKENYHFSERSFGSFQRSIRLPFPADAGKVKANFDNGVLTITLPKGQEQDRSRRIQVQSGKTSH